jgi:RHS repeat-associated protein
LHSLTLAPSGTTTTPQYGGNISQVVWQVKGREKQVYTLNYDAVNRMTQATYSDVNNAGAVTGNRYDEKLTYDIRGNINTLQRWGLNGSCTWGMIDNLTYNYGASGYNIKNKLNSVTDGSDLTKGFKTISNGSAYSYDADGNMTADPNKGITNIVYNHMNLPTTITFTGGNAITFMYDAGGNKLRKTVTGTTAYVQDYVGGIEYRGGVLEAVYHAEGRITTINGALKYEYALKDHLGNTRLMFSDKDGNGKITQSASPEPSEVTQENHYYPFGLNMEMDKWSNTPSVPDSKYQYNGKELNDDYGLGLMDYGARMYDAAIGKWNAVDPMADAYHAYTPYGYVRNNPMRLIDPNGMSDFDANGRDMFGNTEVQGGAMMGEGGFVSGKSKGSSEVSITTTTHNTLGGVIISTSTSTQIVSSAWAINNIWDDKQIAAFRERLNSLISTMEAKGDKYSCEDFALSCIMNFAKERQLPFKWETGSKNFDASNSQYSDADSFTKAVMDATGAIDFQRNANTSLTDKNNAKVGDIITLYNPASHVQVITATYGTPNVAIDIKQGNLSGHLLRIPQSIQSGTHLLKRDEYYNVSDNQPYYNVSSGLKPQLRTYNFTKWN